MLKNIDQRGQRGRNMVDIHNPLTALLGWDKLSSDCKINSLTTLLIYLAD